MLRFNKYNTCIIISKTLTFTIWHAPHPYNVNIFEKTCFACIDTVTKSCLKMTAWDTVETGRSVSLLLNPEQYIFISNLWVPAETTENTLILICEFQQRLQKTHYFKSASSSRDYRQYITSNLWVPAETTEIA